MASEPSPLDTFKTRTIGRPLQQVKRSFGRKHAEPAAQALWAQIHGLAVLLDAGVLPWEEAHARLKFNLKIWLKGATTSPANE